MAILLADHDLKKLIGSIIIDGDPDCLRPNSYVLRLGGEGEFLSAGKEFELGKKKKGIKVPPGHSVGVTAFETLDFRRETVEKLFPEKDLHGILSPTTDLSREGIVAPATHIDAGYRGTLNWTISNTSNEERKFLFKEKIFRLTIWLLEKGERAETLYSGDYQDATGYVRSRRKGAPVGMKETEWEDPLVSGGPEGMLDNLIKSGYPWHLLGEKLKMIDGKFQQVTNEYEAINDSIQNLTKRVDEVVDDYGKLSKGIAGSIKETLSSEMNAIQNRWLLGGGTLLLVFIGLIISVIGNDHSLEFFKANSFWIGPILLVVGFVILYLLFRKPKKEK